MGEVNIIWDWNGTLLNDLNLCIMSINTLLERRKLPLLSNQSYREVFSFPVRDYYMAIGFDFKTEEFAIPAQEFIDLYEIGVSGCSLHDQAVEVLSHFRDKGCRQFVLSAMHQDMLVKTLKHNDIYHYFEGVAGLDDHYAVSKVERGRQLIARFNINREHTLMIGDTNHDSEVAQDLGIACVLVADGHQSVQRLEKTGTPVVKNLAELMQPEKFSFFS
jgi:phosphoglycolate phosphatase